MTAVAQVLAGLADALIPPRCAGCMTPGSWFCTPCRDSCDPLEGGTPGLPMRAAGAYEGPLRGAIQSFKYRGERALATELGSLIASRVAADLAAGVRVDLVVPVALHPSRVRERGYDQTVLLADETSMRVALPTVAAIHRIRHARPQVELDRMERARNVSGAFVATVGDLRALHIALVDDVTTTGATLREAARAARAAGARSVRAYVIAADE